MKAEYIVERTALGWLLCSAPGLRGIPASALSEVEALFPKNAVMDAGIARHYSVIEPLRRAVYAVASPANAAKWRKQIEELMAPRGAEMAWWGGTDVGTSSAAIFAVLASDRGLAQVASEYANGATPRDGDDFGRCVRLIARFPGWKDRLAEVVARYPGSRWHLIVERWDWLRMAAPAEVSLFFRGA